MSIERWTLHKRNHPPDCGCLFDMELKVNEPPEHPMCKIRCEDMFDEIDETKPRDQLFDMSWAELSGDWLDRFFNDTEQHLKDERDRHVKKVDQGDD